MPNALRYAAPAPAIITAINLCRAGSSIHETTAMKTTAIKIGAAYCNKTLASGLRFERRSCSPKSPGRGHLREPEIEHQIKDFVRSQLGPDG